MSSNQPQRPNTGNDLLEQARQVIEQGNMRRVIVRKADGETLIEVSVTLAVIAGVILLLIGPLGLMIALGAVAYGVFTKVQVEVVRELTDDDTVVQIDATKSKNDAES